jgi:hypothetical protein
MCACPPSDLETLCLDLAECALEMQKHKKVIEISKISFDTFQNNFNRLFKRLKSLVPEVYQEIKYHYTEPEVEVIDVDFEYV